MRKMADHEDRHGRSVILLREMEGYPHEDPFLLAVADAEGRGQGSVAFASHDEVRSFALSLLLAVEGQ